MEVGQTLHAKTRSEWRAWLRKHHKTEPEIWLVYHRKASGKPFVAYDDAVEEALCFGWIDSIIKKLPDDARAQRFTPRRPRSPMSELNKARVRRMIEAGKMTPAGLDVAGDLDGRFVVPRDIERELKKDREVWANFQAFPDSYKRIRIGWIDGARPRMEFYEQRLRYFIKMTKQGKKFGTLSGRKGS
jgi:uncharacterized protein YdeI (YjbR/CyaY-like superfamily)